MAVADEEEVAGAHPFQKCTRLGDLAGRHGRRITCQRLNELGRALPHGQPVGDCEPHVAQCGAQLLLQFGDACSVGLAINLIELPRFCMAVRLALGVHAGQSATAVALDA